MPESDQLMARPPVPRPRGSRRLARPVQACRAGELWEGTPQAILSTPDEASRADAMGAFVADLERVRKWLSEE